MLIDAAEETTVSVFGDTFVILLPTGGGVCYRLLCQKLSLDRRPHLRLQSGGLGRHTAAVSLQTSVQTHIY